VPGARRQVEVVVADRDIGHHLQRRCARQQRVVDAFATDDQRAIGSRQPLRQLIGRKRMVVLVVVERVRRAQFVDQEGVEAARDDDAVFSVVLIGRRRRS